MPRVVLAAQPAASARWQAPMGRGADGAMPSQPAAPERGLLQSVNWQPPTKSAQPVHVASTLNIDGRMLAQAVADKLAEMMEFPTSAPYWDGKRGFSPQDMQTTST
jgi:hypothetical protein